jgi:hypothetical protein
MSKIAFQSPRVNPDEPKLLKSLQILLQIDGLRDSMLNLPPSVKR